MGSMGIFTLSMSFPSCQSPNKGGTQHASSGASQKSLFFKKKKRMKQVFRDGGRVEDETELSGPNRCQSQEVRPEPPPLWEETPAGALLSL